jgi:excisionase family DNA binding protein
MTRDEILTIPEVAELLKVGERTVYSLAQRRELPCFKVGGQWRFSRGALHQWIQRKTQATIGEGRAPAGSSGTKDQRSAAPRGQGRPEAGR